MTGHDKIYFLFYFYNSISKIFKVLQSALLDCIAKFWWMKTSFKNWKQKGIFGLSSLQNLYIPDYNMCSSTVTLKRCDWLNTGTEVSTSCQYKCPCAGNGCEVFLVDGRKEKSANICEFSLIDSLNE